MSAPGPNLTVNLTCTQPLQPGDRILVSLPETNDETQEEYFRTVIGHVQAQWPDVNFLFIVGGQVVVVPSDQAPEVGALSIGQAGALAAHAATQARGR